jgi:hypothetical protein
MMVKGQRFETVSRHPKGNSKWYSTALRKITSMMLLKRGKNDGIAVHSQGYYFEGDASQNFLS